MPYIPYNKTRQASQYYTKIRANEIPEWIHSTWYFRKMSTPHPQNSKITYWTAGVQFSKPEPEDFYGHVVFLTGNLSTPVGFVSRLKEDGAGTILESRMSYKFETTLFLEDSIVCESRNSALSLADTVDDRAGQASESRVILSIWEQMDLDYIQNFFLPVYQIAEGNDCHD